MQNDSRNMSDSTWITVNQFKSRVILDMDDVGRMSIEVERAEELADRIYEASKEARGGCQMDSTGEWEICIERENHSCIYFEQLVEQGEVELDET